MKTIKWRRSLYAALLLIGISPVIGTTSAQTADVVVGVPNWPSAVATANILKVVLEDNLGLEVELQNGTNPIIFEAMDNRQACMCIRRSGCPTRPTCMTSTSSRRVPLG